MLYITYVQFIAAIEHFRTAGVVGTIVLDLRRNVNMVIDGWLEGDDMPIPVNDNRAQRSV